MLAAPDLGDASQEVRRVWITTLAPFKECHDPVNAVIVVEDFPAAALLDDGPCEVITRPLPVLKRFGQDLKEAATL